MRIFDRLENLWIRASLTSAGAARAIKANLKGNFNVTGVTPLPLKRSADSPVKIYYFTDANGKWEEYKAADVKMAIQSIGNNQLAVSEAPVKMRLNTTTCAALTLYDPDRRVGAVMHFHKMDSGIYRGYIALALYKMGILDNGRMSKVEARILGVETVPTRIQKQKEWVKNIKAFLEACLVKVIAEEVGKKMSAKFDLNDGSVKYENS